MKNIFLLLSVLSLLFAFSACEKPPTEEMELAHEMVARAENNADAVNFAGLTLTRARGALNNMQIEADAKRYETARTYAAEAISLAERAIEEGMIGAILAREEAAALNYSLLTLLEETASAINAAGADGSLDLDVNALSAELDSARRLYNEARQDLLDDNLRDALSKNQTVRSTLSNINGRITTAAQAALGKK